MENNLGTDARVFGEHEAGRYLGGETAPISQRTLQRWCLDATPLLDQSDPTMSRQRQKTAKAVKLTAATGLDRVLLK